MVKSFVGEKELEIIPTGYARLQKQIDKALDVITEQTCWFVTDLDLSIEQIDQICSNEFVKFLIYADHHPKSNEWLEWMKKVKLPKNLRIHFDEGKCGAKIIYDALRKSFKQTKDNPKMDELVRIADIYDRWQENHEDFILSMRANYLFWEIKFWSFVKYMKDGWRMGKTATFIIDRVIIDRDSYIKETIENYTLKKEVKGIIIALVVNPEGKYVNDFKYLNKQFDVTIIFGGYHENGQNWSLRTSDKMISMGISSQDFTEQMTKKYEEVNGGGHPAAAGVFINSNDIKSIAERLLDDFELYVESTLP